MPGGSLDHMIMVEVTRLVLGLLIALFHKPLADFITEQDTQLVALFRQRGISVPNPFRRETARNLYFFIGIAVAMIELARIYSMIHPH